MKKLIIILVVIGVIIAAVYFLQNGESELEANVPKITTAKVERGPIVLSVSTTGRVVANLDVDIKCKASGEVTTLPFDVSDTVKKGELLVELNPVDEKRYLKQAQISLSATEARLAQAKQSLLMAQKDLETQKKRAQVALKSAQARAEDAKTKFERVNQLLAKKLASQEEYDTAETASIQAAADLEGARVRLDELETQELGLELKRQDVKLAEAQVESDKISLSTAQQRLTDTKVYAPIDGVVSARNVQTGQIISSGISNVGGGTTVLTLSDLLRIFILASVDESDIGRVKTGQTATITVDAFPQVRFSGEVVRIATKGLSTANVVTFEVKIEVLGRNKDMLKPEMTANVEIIAAQEESALLVPVEAVSRMRGKRYIIISNVDGTTEQREVEVGISDGVKMAVSSGLSEGETLLIREGEADSRWRGSRGMPGMPFGGRRR